MCDHPSKLVTIKVINYKLNVNWDLLILNSIESYTSDCRGLYYRVLPLYN